MRAGVQRLFRDGRLVDHGDVRILQALCDDGRVDIGRALINRNFAERPERLPAQIAGVFGVAVQNDQFHVIPSKMHLRGQVLRSVFQQRPGAI